MNHKTAAIVALVGGLVVAVGSFLPWATVTSGLGSLSVAGTSGDGIITIVIGGLIALLALLSLDRTPRPIVTLAIALLGVGAAILGGWEVMNLNAKFADVATKLIVPSIGYGLFLVIGGGIAAAIGGGSMAQRGQPAAPPEPPADAPEPAPWPKP